MPETQPKLEPCRACKAQVHTSCATCPRCGVQRPAPSYYVWKAGQARHYSRLHIGLTSCPTCKRDVVPQEKVDLNVALKSWVFWIVMVSGTAITMFSICLWFPVVGVVAYVILHKNWGFRVCPDCSTRLHTINNAEGVPMSRSSEETDGA